MSVSVVEYEGFLTSGAATLTPALRYDAPTYSIGGQGSWTVFESGNQILQLTAATAWYAQLRNRWRLELSGATGIARYAEQTSSAHFLTRSRLHFSSSRGGGWLGATTGTTYSGNYVSPVELALGGWLLVQRLALVGTVTSTWIDGDRHIDLLGAARWTVGRLELEARLNARPWTAGEADGLGAARAGVSGEVSALVPLGQRIALAVSAGSYPSDPVRRVLAANYATVGLRFGRGSPDDTRSRVIADAAVATRRSYVSSDDAALPRLEVVAGSNLQTLRLYAPGATEVEVMGDFTDWQPTTLTKVGPETWEMKLALTPGVHRLNVRINGGEWLVPAGVRLEEGEFGGAVGVLTVR